jgi:hypothetical protein
MNTVVTKEKTYYEDFDGDEVTDSDEETVEVPDFSGVAVLANAVKDMGTLTSLNVSSNSIGRHDIFPDGWKSRDGDGAAPFVHADGRKQDTAPEGTKSSGVIALADAISDMGALSLANVMGNRIGKEMLSNLQDIMRSKPNLVSLCGIADDATEADLSGLNINAADAIILASELPDKRALTTLNLAYNELGEIVLAAGWRSKNTNGCYPWVGPDGQEQRIKPGKPEGAITIADAIRDMGALSVLSLKKNQLGTKEAGIVLGQMLKTNSTLKDLDISENMYYSGGWKIDPEFVQGLAAGIKDNGAISSVNMLDNSIGIEQARALASLLKEHPTLKSLCGNKGDETELDMSGKRMGAGGAIMLATEIVGNRALASLNLVSNRLGAEGAKIIAAILPECT